MYREEQFKDFAPRLRKVLIDCQLDIDATPFFAPTWSYRPSTTVLIYVQHPEPSEITHANRHLFLNCKWINYLQLLGDLEQWNGTRQSLASKLLWQWPQEVHDKWKLPPDAAASLLQSPHDTRFVPNISGYDGTSYLSPIVQKGMNWEQFMQLSQEEQNKLTITDRIHLFATMTEQKQNTFDARKQHQFIYQEMEWQKHWEVDSEDVSTMMKEIESQDENWQLTGSMVIWSINMKVDTTQDILFADPMLWNQIMATDLTIEENQRFLIKQFESTHPDWFTKRAIWFGGSQYFPESLRSTKGTLIKTTIHPRCQDSIGSMFLCFGQCHPNIANQPQMRMVTSSSQIFKKD